MLILNDKKIPYKLILYLFFTVFFMLFICQPRDQEFKPICKDNQFIEGLNGWLFWKYDFQPAPIFPESLTPYLLRFRQALEKKHIKLIIIPIPNKGMMLKETDHALSELQWLYMYPLIKKSQEVYQSSTKKLALHGFLIVNLLEYVKHNDIQKASNEYFFYKTDHHWSAYGAKLSAKALTDLIRKFDRLKLMLPKKDFMTQRVSTLPFLGSTGNAYQTSCKLEWTQEESSRYETVFASSSGQDLFTESIPKVVLAGSSFSQSTRDFNFPGFISDSLHTSVLTYAENAHYLFGWLAAYLTSDDYANSKPKLLIWEAPGLFWNETEVRHENQIPWLRHIIPSVYGACTKDDQIYYSKWRINKNIKNYLIIESLKRYARGSNYYIHILSSNKKVKNMNFKIVYKNRELEKISLNFDKFSNNNGNFYLELSNTIKSSLKDLKISFTGDSGSLIIQICHLRN